MCAKVGSQCLEYLGYMNNFDPNAHFIASVSDQNPNNGNIFVFVIAIQKKDRQSGLFFQIGTKKK